MATRRVGCWKSADGQRTYARAYNELLATLPPVSRALDVPIGFGTTHVLEWKGGPQSAAPVVLLPGRSSGAPMWSEILPDWLGKRTLYAFDAIGDAGLSTQSMPLRSFDDQAEWIAQTLSALGLPRAHLVGHSFGGASAAIHALRYPDQLASVTLLEPVLLVQNLPASVYFWTTVSLLPGPRSWRDRALAEIGGVSVQDIQERTPMSLLIEQATVHFHAALPNPRRLTDDEWRSLKVPLRLDIAGTSSLAGAKQGVDRIRSLLPTAEVTL